MTGKLHLVLSELYAGEARATTCHPCRSDVELFAQRCQRPPQESAETAQLLAACLGCNSAKVVGTEVCLQRECRGMRPHSPSRPCSCSTVYTS